MNSENSISYRVKELRKYFGMTQTEFAKKLGVTQQQVCQLERSSRNIRPAVISSICANFNVDERWLRTGEGEMFKRAIDAPDLARTLQLAICRRIFDSMPEDVQDTMIAICRKESAKRNRRQAKALKAKEVEETQNMNEVVQVEETKA